MGFVPRLALFYAAMFAAVGVQMPFLPVWLAAKGLDERAIGLLLAVSALVRLATIPTAARAADRLGTLKGALVAASLAAAVSTLWLGTAAGIVAMAVSFALASAALSTALPLADAYALKGLAARRRPYGPVRLWGSAAFIAGNLMAGYLADAIAPMHLIWPVVGAFCVMAASAALLVPVAVEAPSAAAHPPAARALLHRPVFVLVALASSLIQGSHAVYYAFSSLDWTGAGYSGLTVGALWSIGVLAEIALFALSGRFPAALHPIVLLALGALGGALRWTMMAFDPPAALLPGLQVLHALSFGATHLGAVQMLARLAPAGLAATAQGFLAMANGLVMALAMAGAGMLHAALGVGAYAAMALMAAAGAALAILAYRLGRGEAG